MRSRSIWSLLAMVVLLLAPLSANAADPSPAGDDTTLRIGTINEPNTASPMNCCVWWPELTWGYDQLVGKDALGQPVPTFAESWTVSPDARTWTFKIRSGMTWSDGQPADANDAAFTFNYYMKSADSKNPQVTYLTMDTVSATAPDAQTLVLQLKDPSTLPLTDRLYILPQHIWKDVKYDDLPTFNAEPPVVGTGPFLLTKWVHGQYQEYTRNDSYWGTKPTISKILVQFYQTTDAAVAALKAGEIDFTETVNVSAVDQLKADPNIKVIDAPWTHYVELMLNGRKPGPRFDGDQSNGPGGFSTALADPAFRDAIRYAIDTQKLVDVALAGHGQPGVSAVSPSDTNNYTGLTDIVAHFDLELAKQKLDAAGYKDSNGDGTREDKQGKELAFPLLADTWDPMFKPAAQLISEWFAQIGIKATPSVDASGNKIYSNDYDMNVGGGLATILNRWDYWGGIYNGTDEPAVHAKTDELKATLALTTDPAARKDLIAQLDRNIYLTEGKLVLFYPNKLQAYRTDKFTGWDTLGADKPLTDIDLYSVPTFTALAPISAAASPSAEAPSAATSEAPASAAPATPAPSAATTDTSGSSNTLPIAIVVIVIVAAGVILLLRRRGSSS